MLDQAPFSTLAGALPLPDPQTDGGPPAPPGARPSRPSRRGRFAAAAVSLVAGAGALWAVGDAGRSPYPDGWDRRVTDLVSFAEDARGLEFVHPVAIDFLPVKDFVTEVTSDPAELTEEERVDQEHFEALSRAIGLSRGDVDLFAVGNQLAADSILAYYDSETERVVVRGTEMTVGVRVTLVHELIHALQDQHFDLDRQGSYETDARNSALEAIIEGDANRIAHLYLRDLPDDEFDAYFDEVYPEDDEEAATDPVARGPGDVPLRDGEVDVPEWLSAYSDAPYALGEPFVDAVFASRGQAGIDEVLRDPPLSEEQLMDPARYLSGDRPKTVGRPRLAKSDQELEAADFGTFSWLVMLAERIPVADAVAAVDGWGGDAYVAFERNGRVCALADFVGDDGAETTQMEQALRAFARAMPAGAANVTRKGAVVELLSCDPGTAAEPVGSGGSGAYDALDVLAARSTTFAQLLGNNLDEGPAACVAGRMLQEFSVAEMNSEVVPDRYEERMTPIRQRCLSPDASRS